MKIQKIIGREVLDSRGNPTVEAQVHTKMNQARAIVPSGASTGVHEATELRDNDKKRFGGKGVLKAVKNVFDLNAKLVGMDVRNQLEIDTILNEIDGTTNKSNLGANAILSVSMAVCKLAAIEKNINLHDHISNLSKTKKQILPRPFFNVINGGQHAGNELDFQEFMISPRAKTFSECYRIGAEVYAELKKQIKIKYGIDAINVGDEGGFAPPLKDIEEPLKLIMKSIKESGYSNKVDIALDCAASEFFSNDVYLLGSKNAKKDKMKRDSLKGISGKNLAKIYQSLFEKYPIISIEDPFAEDDWKTWTEFMQGTEIQVVGDDLLVTNVDRIKNAFEYKACNALLLKVNQIGTVTESINATLLAKKQNWQVMVSHRSGETEDTFIADLVVGLGVRKNC